MSVIGDIAPKSAIADKKEKPVRGKARKTKKRSKKRVIKWRDWRMNPLVRAHQRSYGEYLARRFPPDDPKAIERLIEELGV
jgi:hypothetical protein